MRSPDKQMKYIPIFSVVLRLTFSRCSSKVRSFDWLFFHVLSESLCVIFFCILLRALPHSRREMTIGALVVRRYCWLPPAAVCIYFRTRFQLLLSEMVLPCLFPYRSSFLFFFCCCENTKNFYLLIKACFDRICKRHTQKWWRDGVTT